MKTINDAFALLHTATTKAIEGIDVSKEIAEAREIIAANCRQLEQRMFDLRRQADLLEARKERQALEKLLTPFAPSSSQTRSPGGRTHGGRGDGK